MLKYYNGNNIIKILKYKNNNTISMKYWTSTIRYDNNNINKDINIKSNTININNENNKNEKSNNNKCSTTNDNNNDDDLVELEEMFVMGPKGMEWNGPTRGGQRPEPTRYGDWERKGRASDF